MEIRMVKKFRRFMAVLCIMMLCFTTYAFAAETSTTAGEEKDRTAEAQYYAQNYAESYGSISEDELKYVADNATGVEKKMAEGIYAYAKNDGLGELLSTGDVDVVKNDGIYTVKVPMTYEKGNMTMTFEMKYLLDGLRVTDVSVTFASTAAKASIGATMKQAGINTVIGISVVFLMLAFMSILIAQFKHVNKLTAGRKNKKEDAASEGIDNAVSKIVESEESAADDLELVAVITAAIAASEDAPADGFTVRSIRRVRF